MTSAREISEAFAGERDPYDAWVAANEAAGAVGCKVVYPNSNQLQIDIDSDAAHLLHNKRLGEFVARSGETAFTSTEAPSKSGLPHRHITITFDNRVFSTWERVAMQLMLGSDPTREALSVLRYVGGDKNPSRLFEPAS